MTMDFNEYVTTNRDAIYKAIMSYMPLKDPVDHYRIVREYSERQGSYRRPGLLMLAGEMFSVPQSKLVLPAAAMQLSEDWILMHDDVEDNSELRRGKPALHKIYGSEIAINAGDAAHIIMWRMLKDYMDSEGKEIGGRLYDKFYDMLEYTVAGQYVENNFIFNVKSLSKASEELYFRIAAGKTCYYTVYGPMQLGAIVAGQSDGTLGVMKSIGEPAGIAFQIVDDILDMTADEKEFGKRRYGDLYEGKLTLIMLHAYNSASAQEKEKADGIYAKARGQKTAQEIEFLEGLASKYGSVDYARSVAEKYSAAAWQAMDRYRGIMPDNAYSETLLCAVESMYKRSK